MSVNSDALLAEIVALLGGGATPGASPIGALDDAAETDPDAASASLLSLMRGVLQRQADIEALIGTAADNAGDPTVIGLLKQIAANTTA